jgi:hypothetical protein
MAVSFTTTSSVTTTGETVAAQLFNESGGVAVPTLSCSIIMPAGLTVAGTTFSNICSGSVGFTAGDIEYIEVAAPGLLSPSNFTQTFNVSFSLLAE